MKRTYFLLAIAIALISWACTNNSKSPASAGRTFNDKYEREYLSRVAFPIGGIDRKSGRVGKECVLGCRSRWSPYH
jgi:hypothetical protein